MSDNLPAIPQPDRTPAVADVDSWIPVLKNVGHLAELICDTEFVPRALRGSAPATAAAMLYGREVGLPPMTALTQTHVIEGKPSMSAEAMRALIIAAGHHIEFEESTGAVCRMRGKRTGTERWLTVEWTIDMARAAGLLGKSNWKSYPRDMLIARCTASLAKMLFPDVIHGFRAVEEVQDMGDDTTSAEQVPPAAPTAKVKRQSRAAAQLPAAKASAPAEPVATVAEVPLPGEPGYDDMTSGAGDGAAAPASGVAVESTAHPAPEPEPAVPAVEGEPAESAGEPASDDDDTGGPTPADDSEQRPAGDVGQHNEEAPAPAAGEEPGEASSVAPPRAPSRAQSRMLMATLRTYGLDKDEEERRAIASRILNREVTTFMTLTADETSALIDTFARCKTLAEVYSLLDAMDQADAETERPES